MSEKPEDEMIEEEDDTKEENDTEEESDMEEGDTEEEEYENDEDDGDDEDDEGDEIMEAQVDSSVAHMFMERGLINTGNVRDQYNEVAGSLQLRSRIFPNSPNAEKELNAFIEEKDKRGAILLKSVQKTIITGNTIFIWYYDL